MALSVLWFVLASCQSFVLSAFFCGLALSVLSFVLLLCQSMRLFVYVAGCAGVVRVVLCVVVVQILVNVC